MEGGPHCSELCWCWKLICVSPDFKPWVSGEQSSLPLSVAARVSRRQLLQRGAVALGGVAGVGLTGPTAGFGRSVGAPRPIPGGFDQNFTMVSSGASFHFLPPAIGFEMSTITDFHGAVGGSETRGTAHGSDGTRYSFDADMRFMRGVYVGLDGRVRHGSFGFI
jgi:hypothetical protein